MRIGLFGDVHGNVEALEAVLAALRDAGCEALLCAGDLVDYGPDPEAAAERSLEAATACVAGNHDLAIATGDGAPLWDRPGRDGELERACFEYTLARLPSPLRRRLGALPRNLRWPPAAPWLLLAHGSPDDPGEYVTEQLPASRLGALAARAERAAASWLCLGHTHLPMRLREGGTTICNAGSVGWPKDGDWRASCAVIDDGGPRGERPQASPGAFAAGPASFRVLRVPYDVERTIAKLRRAGLPERLAAAVAAGRPSG